MVVFSAGHFCLPKCTGTRPTCFRCSVHEKGCSWDTEPDTTRVESLRRRYENLEKKNEDMRQLLRYLCVRPEPEAREIFNRLRSTGDALRVLELVRMGDILLGKHVERSHDDAEQIKTAN